MKYRELFENAENGTLTYEQFAEAAKAAGAKFVDLSEGGYVSQNKYNDDIAAKTSEIQTLNATITARDSDLEGLKKQLSEAGADANKLAELTNSFSELQTKYDTDMENYKKQIEKQAYDFAVDRFADGKLFSSKAAKREFTREMKAAGLKMNGETIMGAEDFATAWQKENGDAFMTEEDFHTPELPRFADSTNDVNLTQPDNAFHFNFTGVRPME